MKRTSRRSKAKQWVTTAALAAAAILIGFSLQFLDHVYAKKDVKLKCAVVQIFGDENTYGERGEDGNSLTVHKPTDVRCFAAER